TGMPLGSPPYMAPEQAAGRNRDVGPASDVYALGAILYELVTGRPPSQGETTAETLLEIIEREPAAPRLLRRGLPRDPDTIILTCLAKEPARRYETAALLADDLRRFLAHEPIRARRPSLARRVSRWARRRPALTTSVVALVALASIVTWFEARRLGASAE